jgi:hypothetical protein
MRIHPLLAEVGALHTQYDILSVTDVQTSRPCPRLLTDPTLCPRTSLMLALHPTNTHITPCEPPLRPIIPSLSHHLLLSSLNAQPRRSTSPPSRQSMINPRPSLNSRTGAKWAERGGNSHMNEQGGRKWNKSQGPRREEGVNKWTTAFIPERGIMKVKWARWGI